jgi:hypothetical protein
MSKFTFLIGFKHYESSVTVLHLNFAQKKPAKITLKVTKT